MEEWNSGEGPWEELKFRRAVTLFVRLRNFGVTGGALRKGSRDLHAKTFMQTAAEITCGECREFVLLQPHIIGLRKRAVFDIMVAKSYLAAGWAVACREDQVLLQHDR